MPASSYRVDAGGNSPVHRSAAPGPCEHGAGREVVAVADLLADADDLRDLPDAVDTTAEHDEVHARGDGGGDEASVEVLTGEQRQRGELAQRLACRVGVHRRHPGGAAVEREEHVEGLGTADLTDDDAVGSHPQGLPDEVSQRDCALALEVRLSTLHRDDVRTVDAQLEDLLARDDPFACRDRGEQAVQESGLSRADRTGHHDRQSGLHRRVEEPGGRRGARTELDELGTRVRSQPDELADVHRPMARDRRDRDVEPAPVREAARRRTAAPGPGGVRPAPACAPRSPRPRAPRGRGP